MNHIDLHWNITVTIPLTWVSCLNTNIVTMHFSSVSSLALMAVGATASAIPPPPKGMSAYFTTYNHLKCDIQSQGLTIVEDDTVGLCQDMKYSAISLTVDNVKEGCTGKATLSMF